MQWYVLHRATIHNYLRLHELERVRSVGMAWTVSVPRLLELVVRNMLVI